MTNSAPRPSLVLPHAAEFDRLVVRAQRLLARGRRADAAAAVQMAGAYAWLNHAGVFASAELEGVLRSLSAVLPHSSIEALDVDVLHVATQVYATGGPTQFVIRWLEQDTGRRHALCLTQQSAAPMPSKVSAKADAGLPVIDLTQLPGGLLHRAAALRRLASQASFVVLHDHPHDVVPALAFSDDVRPGIITVNHADHVFWLGSSIPGLLYNMRESGQSLSLERRGIGSERSTVMARPLAPGERKVDRASAKAHFGLAPETRLVVTVADAPKFRSISGPSLVEMVTSLVLADEKLVVLAAGPSAVDDWAEAERVTGGRIRALGRLPNATLLQQAADVYLDSYPFASLTSMLEAGSFGVPLITYRGHPEECAVLGSDTPGVDELIVRAHTPAELREVLEGLLNDPAARKELGDRTRRAIGATHSGVGWQSRLEMLYRDTMDLSERRPGIAPTTRRDGPVDEMVALVQSRTPFHQGVAGAATFALPYFTLRVRLTVWARMAWQRRPVSPLLLLPPGAVAAFTTRRRALGIVRPRSG